MQPRDNKLRLHFALMVILMVVLGLAHAWVNPWLGFDRGAIEQGQIWRLLTCHLVHLNHWHMLLNLAGLVLCGYFFTDLLDRARFWSWLLFCGLATGLALYFWIPVCSTMWGSPVSFMACWFSVCYSAGGGTPGCIRWCYW